MAKFRKKPVVIEAWLVEDLIRDSVNANRDLPFEVLDAYHSGQIDFFRNSIEVRTKEGLMRGEITDMLIRGVKGEFYPCKPDIFEATYESVSEEVPA